MTNRPGITRPKTTPLITTQSTPPPITTQSKITQPGTIPSMTIHLRTTPSKITNYFPNSFLSHFKLSNKPIIKYLYLKGNNNKY